MHSLRTRLIAAFVVATVLPLAATIGITMSLLESSLGYATTEELDGLSRTLEAMVRQFYQREREALRQDAAIGRSAPTTYLVADIATWPEDVRAFWESTEPERFGLAGPDGDRLDYMRRSTAGVDIYARDLAGIHMQELSTKLRQAREVVGSIEARDLRRGFTLTLLLLVAIVWLISLAPLPWLLARGLFGARRRTRGPVWSTGVAFQPSMQYTGTSFSKPLRLFFGRVLLPERRIDVVYHGASPLPRVASNEG